MKLWPVMLVTVAILVTSASGIAGKVKSQHVGNPHDSGALAAELQKAYANGVRTIIINPGIYHLPAVGHPTFDLKGWEDTTIVAYHVQLIMRVKNGGTCFELNHCRNVTIEGPLISQTQVTFFQGRVLSGGHSKGGAYDCVWRPDVGYPFPRISSRAFPRGFDVVDGRTRHLRVGSGDIWANKVSAVGATVFRLTFRLPHPEFKVGDFLVARYGKAYQKVRLDRSRHCTIKDITMMRNGFAPIFEDGGGANRIIGCRWVLGPKPAGARTRPVVTNQADGFHCVNAYPGPTLENCFMHGVFLDDCIAIHGEFQTVLAVNGNHLVVDDNRNADLAVGQPIQISSIHGFFADSTVLAIHRFQIHNHRQEQFYDRVKPLGGAGSPHNRPAIGWWLSRIRIAAPLHVPLGAYVTNPLRCGTGYKIIGCHIGDTRSRGMLLKGSDGLVEDNVVRGCGMAAISIGPEVWWREAGYVHGVTVINNKLIRNGKSGPGSFFSAIFIHGHGAIGNSDIHIEQNDFKSNFSGAICVQWAKDVRIERNRLAAPSQPAFPGEPPQPAIMADHSRSVATRGNHLVNASHFANPAVVIKR